MSFYDKDSTILQILTGFTTSRTEFEIVSENMLIICNFP